MCWKEAQEAQKEQSPAVEIPKLEPQSSSPSSDGMNLDQLVGSEKSN